MEVAGLALAIPPILTGFMKIVKSVDDIRTKYKTIPSSMDAIAAYCGMVHVSVLHLKSQQFQEALLSVPETTAQMMQHIEVLLLGCKGVLCQIEAYTVQFAERVSMRQRPGLDILQLTRLVWKEPEVKDLLAQLRDYKGGIDTIRQICMSQSLESIQTQLSRYTPTLDILLERSRQSWNKDPPLILASRPESLRFSFISHMSRFSTTALYINQDHDRQSITAFDFDYEVVNSRIYKHAMADEGRRAAIAAFRVSVADSLHVPEEHGEDNLESVREEGTDPHTRGVIEAWNTPNPPTTSVSSCVNPVTGLTEVQEEAIFEDIFLALTSAYDSALQAIPIARRQFTRCWEAAEENQAPKEVKTLWSNLIWRCKTCLEISEALQARLVNMRLKDPVVSAAGVLNGRNDRAFWQLCKKFMQSFVELVAEMKKAKDLRLLAQDIIIVLKPVQKASREAGRLVEASPWAYLTGAPSTTSPSVTSPSTTSPSVTSPSTTSPSVASPSPSTTEFASRFLRKYKIAVIGGGGVDQLSLIIQFMLWHFVDEYEPTIVGSYRKMCVIDGEVALLDVLDTAAQEEYSAMREQFMRSSDGFVLVYSITSRQSFQETITFQQQILRTKDKDYFPMIIVGNHCDREDERQVSKQEGAALARGFGGRFVEASSKDRINVDVTFYDLVRDIRKYERLERELNVSRAILTDYPAPPAKRSSTNRLLTPWPERLRR